jgi:crotonobetainyl-CoA:carnitine CoA-transferase CaiB-like acyl-CoA transferase
METRMIASGAYAVSDEFLDYAGKPSQRLPDAGQHGFHALYRLYDTGRGWVMLACPREREWRALCAALGCADWLTDPRFASPEDRRANDASLAAAIEAALRERSAAEWETFFRERGVPAVRADGPRWNVFLNTDPGAAANGLRAMAHYERFGGDYYRTGATVHFSDMETVLGAPPVIGAHTAPILRELGYTDPEIDALEAEGIIVRDGPWGPGQE